MTAELHGALRVAQERHHRGRGVTAPERFQKKGKIRKHGVFPCIGVIKISFSVIF